jgi:hypothetical protein
MGFYTARLVEADSPQEAANKAVAMIEEEIKALHRPNYPWSISVEEVWEGTSQSTKYPSSGGFIWYPEEDSH